MTVINTNTSAMRATNASTSANRMLSTSMERLSTGKRINSAKDDAAGLAIANRMTSQTKSMAMAVRNANDGISLAQTAEGAMGEVTNMLTRMKELATQSANGTLKDSDRTALQSEMSQLTAEITNVAKTTSFNGVNLLDGSSDAVKLQTGINADQTISMKLTDTRSSTLGITAQSQGSTVTAAAFDTANDALKINGETIAIANGTTKDAKAISDLINAKTATSGVTATAKNTLTMGVNSIGANKSFDIGGTTITTTAAEKDAVSLAAKINTTLGSSSNIVATTDSTNNLVLTSKDGSNITVKNTDGVLQNAARNTKGDAVTLSATAVTSQGQITLDAESGKGVTIEATGAGATGAGLTAGTVSAVSIATQTGASAAMAVIDSALDKVSAARGTMGAAQNRLESTVNNLTTTATNLSDAKSRIEDADFSTETTALAKAQILGQASTAMLAQANQSQQGVMKLLG